MARQWDIRPGKTASRWGESYTSGMGRAHERAPTVSSRPQSQWPHWDSSFIAPIRRCGPGAEDSSRLSVLTRAAGVAFASIIAMDAANCFKNREHILSFCRTLGASNATYVEMMSPDIPIELLILFMRIEVPATISKVLDLTHPGSADLFGVYLGEISKQYGSGSIGFRRSGIVGFGALVTTLSEHTVTAVQGAARQFGF